MKMGDIAREIVNSLINNPDLRLALGEALEQRADPTSNSSAAELEQELRRTFRGCARPTTRASTSMSFSEHTPR